jgi:hypothetical protein
VLTPATGTVRGRWSRPAVLKMYSVDPLGYATSSQGIRGYISVTAAMKFAYCFNQMNDGLLKIIAGPFKLAICLLRMTVRVSN